MNVNHYIETLLNPQGMFLTLGDKIQPRTKKGGQVDFWIENRIAFFRIRIKGVKHILWCFLGDRTKARQHFKILSLQLRQLKNPYLIKWQFLHDEMLVQDNFGREARYDVIIQKEVNSQNVFDFLNSTNCYDNSLIAQKLLGNLALMHDNFYDQGIAFNGIDFSKLQITKDYSPLLLQCGMMTLVNKDKRDEYAQHFSADSKSFAVFGCFLALQLVVDGFIKSLIERSVLNMNYMSELLPQIEHYAVQVGFSQLAQLAQCAISSTVNRESISKLLNYLKDNDLSPVKSRAQNITFGSNLTYNLSNDYVVKEQNGRFFFMNSHTKEKVFDKDFDYCEPFSNNCAVVSEKGRYALIDSMGKYILPAEFDDITWYDKANFVVAKKENYYYLYNNKGRRINELVFDFIGEPEEGKFTAKLSNNYGHINMNAEFEIDYNTQNTDASALQGKTKLHRRIKEV